MTITDDAVRALDDERRDDLAERLFTGLLASMELVSVHLGLQLGLYAALRTEGPATPPELARRAGIHPRYAREWLEQQAAAGVLDVVGDEDTTDAAADRRRFSLPAGHAEALLDPDSPAAVSGVGSGMIGIVGVVDALVAAYRSGGGVPFADYGAGIRHGIGGMNRPMFTNGVASWLAAAPALDARLRALPAPRILDVGCGTGWSSIALARAYPLASVHGIDLDRASVDDATRNAVAAGVADRVSFEARDAVTVDADDGRFDLACVFEAIHDMAHPVRALGRIRAVLAEGGAVVVADERVEERFTAPAEFTERLMYAFSGVHCLPATMAEHPSIATGTVLRAPTMRRYAAEAGYRSVDELPVENPFWRFYALAP
jgi:SAM-dependent methyltransferase